MNFFNLFRKRDKKKTFEDITARQIEVKIDTYLLEGKKIEAIKFYRRTHDTSLKEAKSVIDIREYELNS